MACARTRVEHALIHVVDHVVGADAQHRFIHCNIDRLTFSGALGAEDCSQGRRNHHERVEVVACVGSCRHCFFRGTVLVHVTRIILDGQVICRGVNTLGITNMAETGNVHNDQTGVDLPQELIGDSLSCPHGALRGLNEDIRILDECADNLFSFIRERIHRDGALIASFHFLDELGITHGVATVGVLNPGDIGTPLRHDFACGRNSNFHC